MKHLLSLLLIITNLVTSGVSLKLLWGWYISPLGVPLLGWVQAAGIAILVSQATFIPTTNALATFFGNPYLKQGETKEEIALHRILMSISIDLTMLLVGWLLHFCL